MSRLQHNLRNEHSGICTENITSQKTNKKKKMGSRVRSEQLQCFGRLGIGTTCSWERSRQMPVLGTGVQTRYQSSGELTAAAHQDKDEGRNTTQNYIFLILVTLLSTTERHFSLLGIIILKAPTSSCNRSHTCILRHSKDW